MEGAGLILVFDEIAGNQQKHKSDQACNPWIFLTARTASTLGFPCSRFCRANDADGSCFTIIDEGFVGHDFADCWPNAVLWKRGDMDENFITGLIRQDKSEPAVIIPFDKRACASHKKSFSGELQLYGRTNPCASAKRFSKDYFPMQKLEKIRPSSASASICPVIEPMALCARRSSSAASSAWA